MQCLLQLLGDERHDLGRGLLERGDLFLGHHLEGRAGGEQADADTFKEQKGWEKEAREECETLGRSLFW